MNTPIKFNYAPTEFQRENAESLYFRILVPQFNPLTAKNSIVGAESPLSSADSTTCAPIDARRLRGIAQCCASVLRGVSHHFPHHQRGEWMSQQGVARYKDGNRLGLRQRRAMAEVLRTEANHAGITDC